MKLSEILHEDQLTELNLKHALAGAVLGAAVGAGAVGAAHHQAPTHKVVKQSQPQQEEFRVKKLTKLVLDKYHHNIKPQEAEKVVKLVIKHEKPTFSAEGLLALIGIESSFDKNAKSKLKADPAIGLTQIRPKLNGLNPTDIQGNVENKIKVTAVKMDHLVKRLGNEQDALHAYNVGIKNVLHPDREGAKLNPEYFKRWKSEINRYI